MLDSALPLLLVPAALLADHLLGEPRRLHPLVGFGWLAGGVRAALQPRLARPPCWQRAAGLTAVLALLVPAMIVADALAGLPVVGPVCSGIGLYLTIGMKSLADHAQAVARPLARGDLAAARGAVGQIVGRDPGSLDATRIAQAAVESVLENGADAVFGALFWYAIGGLPLAVGYRLANTLDAMWGHRTPDLLYFGWAAARLDDLLGFLPARLTALTYALPGPVHINVHINNGDRPVRHLDVPPFFEGREIRGESEGGHYSSCPPAKHLSDQEHLRQ